MRLLTTKRTILSLLLLAFMVYQPANVLAQRGTSKGKTLSITDKHGKSTIHFSDNGKDFQIEYEGDITVSNDDTDITSITDGGYLEIEKKSFGSRRRIVIEADRNGNLTKRYYVGRSEKDFNPEGKQWLAEILPEIVRSTRIAAESRVKRFYERGGSRAVLNEIGEITADYVKTTYFKLLLDYNLSASELNSVIKTAGQEIKSDHYLAGILESNQKAFLANQQSTDAYIEATKTLKSDHYVTRVLKKVIKDKNITDSQMESLMEISKSIESDHYVTQILTEIMDSRQLNSRNIAKVISLSKDIKSDHYKTRVLKKAINEKGLSKNAYDAIFGTLKDVKSDHYITEVIVTLFNKDYDGSNLNELLSLMNENIRSGHYASSIYKKIADKRSLSEDQLIDVLKSMSNINSGHYLSEALMAFSSQVKRSSSKVKDAYRNTANSIRSETYYGRAMKAIN